MIANDRITNRNRIIHRILVAVDDSDQARRAVDIAGELGSQLAADLKLLNVVTLPKVITPELVCELPRLRERGYEFGKSLLHSLRNRLPGCLTAKLDLCEGFAAEEIVAEAENWHADLIVMGTRARGRLGQFLLGSTAEAVIHGSPCPVLTVPR